MEEMGPNLFGEFFPFSGFRGMDMKNEVSSSRFFQV